MAGRSKQQSKALIRATEDLAKRVEGRGLALSEEEEIKLTSALLQENDPATAMPLQLSEMVADESGLAASSVLVELAERQIDLDAVLATVRERARWLCGVADQQRAVASVCAEQRAAFIARWQQRAAAFEAEPLESPQGEQPHFDDEFSSSQQQAHAQGQARREDEADRDVDGSALYAMWLG